MKLTIITILILIYISIVHAGHYKWKDKNGTIHFTDNEYNVPLKYRRHYGNHKTKELSIKKEVLGLWVNENENINFETIFFKDNMSGTITMRRGGEEMPIKWKVKDIGEIQVFLFLPNLSSSSAKKQEPFLHGKYRTKTESLLFKGGKNENFVFHKSINKTTSEKPKN